MDRPDGYLFRAAMNLSHRRDPGVGEILAVADSFIILDNENLTVTRSAGCFQQDHTVPVGPGVWAVIVELSPRIVGEFEVIACATCPAARSSSRGRIS